VNLFLDKIVAVLEKTPTVLRALLSRLPEECTTRNEGTDTWSPCDVVAHMIHGEATDWIPRTKIILSATDDKRFEPFDRFAHLQEDRKPIEELLEEFRALREENLKILQQMQITESQLSLQGIHPEFGAVTLRQLLSTWVVHDLDHLSQIARVMAKQYEDDVGPWSRYLRILRKIG